MKLRVQTVLLLSLVLITASCRSSKPVSGKKVDSYMKRTYASLKRSLLDAEVIMNTDTTVRVIFSNPVMFGYNSAWIDSSTYPSFQAFAKVLRSRRSTDIVVSGHSDTIGANGAENMALSVRRADSAKGLLIANKVEERRIKTWGFGAKEPVANNATKDGRSRNRRVEFVVMYHLDGVKND